MRALLISLAAVSLSLVACSGDSATPGAGGGASSGTVAEGAGGGSNASTGAGGSIPPPSTTCDVPATAADVSNPTTVVGTGDGTCTEALLDAAIAAGGVITFDCGASATIPITSAKTVAATTVIDGGNTVTLSAGGANRIFLTQGDGDFTVQNIALNDAMVDGARGDGPSDANSGAAIYRQSNGTLTVIHASFSNDHATDAGADVAGGAIYSYGGDTVIVDSTFTGNSAASGGAVGNLRSNLTIVNSTFSGNSATDQNGGAMYLDGQNADHGKVFTLCGVVVSANRAKNEAGGVYRYGYPGESTVIDLSSFEGNTAEDPSGGLGGGLYVQTDTVGAMPLAMSNSSIAGNTAGRGAGGMFVYNCPTTLTNVTVANNVALNSLGGGLDMNGVPGTLQSVTIAGNHADHPDSFGGGVIGATGLMLFDSIIAGNTAGNAYNPVSCTDAFAGGDHDIQFPATESSGQADTPCVAGITFADPLLGPLMDNGGTTQTMAPGAGSPAIGAGASCPATDQRGAARTPSCDIGACQ
ncbi:MAG TPA: choice-of-anchor Q domain-containing protein [Byssovorax sp.]|jgi:hypothetical protein